MRLLRRRGPLPAVPLGIAVRAPVEMRYMYVNPSQVFTKSSDTFAHVGSVSHGTGSMPNVPSRLLICPNWSVEEAAPDQHAEEGRIAYGRM